MKIGAMRHRIELIQTTKGVNENGFETDIDTVYKKVWSAISNLHGSEFFSAAQVNAENTVKFTIRYLPGVTSDMKINFQDKYYEITAIDNIKYQNDYMEIKAVLSDGKV